MTIIYGDYRIEGDRLVMSVPCERCGTIIGDLDPGEVTGLLSGRYGKVLCFDCEGNSCAVCQKELTERDIKEWQAMSIPSQPVCWFCSMRVAK